MSTAKYVFLAFYLWALFYTLSYCIYCLRKKEYGNFAKSVSAVVVSVILCIAYVSK